MLQAALQFFIFFHIFSQCTSTGLTDKIIGPGAFKFQAYEHCDPPVTEIDLWFSQRKFNRTTNVLDIKFRAPWPLSDNIIMEIKTATKKEGGYKPGTFYIKGPVCTTLQKVLGDLFNAIVDATGYEDCPIPGNFDIEGFYVDSEVMNDVLYGEYRAELLFYVDNETKGCFLMYMELIEKEE